MDDETAPLELRLRALSRDLCAALRDTLESALAADDRVASGSLRPVQLTGVLGLDKSLASRVVKALASPDALLALHGIPTPQGLRLIAGAAREHGATPDALRRLERATTAYGALLGEFEGGRTDLEAALAGWIPAQRSRAERDARRSVLRGMTAMMGTRAQTIYHALYLVPSQHEGQADSLMVGVRQGLRRLRAGAPVLVARLRSAEGASGWGARRTTLQGHPLSADARALLLRDLCSHPIPELDVAMEDEQLVISIAANTLDVNESTTLGFGWRTEGHFELFATAQDCYHHVSVDWTQPSEALVFDFFVHADIDLCEPPSAAMKDGTRCHLPECAEFEIVDLDRTPGGLASMDVRACPAIAETVCREAGFLIGQFRKFRTRVEFPLPTEQLTLWWKRRERPV